MRERRHPLEAPDHNKQFRRLGVLILLLAAFLAIGYFTPRDQYEEWRARVNAPEPRDCDWGTMPVGDKRCHYEKVYSVVNGTPKVTWRRVDD